MSEQTTLREAENKVFIEGILSENKLELKTSDGKEYITGELIIKTDDYSFHSVKMLAYKYNKTNGEESNIFKSLNTVMNDYKSIATHGEENADKVRVSGGKIGLEEYYTGDGTLKSFIKVGSNFVNRLSPQDGYEPKAEFEVEVFVHSMVDEIKNEVPTGRLLVKTLIPLYGGKVIPVPFVTGDAEIAEAFQSTYKKGDTVKLYGNLVNTILTIETEEAVMVGKPKKKLTKKTIREFEVTNGGFPYEEDEPKKYTIDGMAKAMSEREIYLQQLKNKKSGADNSSSASATKSNTVVGSKTPVASKPATVAPKATAKPQIKTTTPVEDDEELPF